MTETPEKPDLDDLGKRIGEAQGGKDHWTTGKKREDELKGSALSLAFRVGIELVSAVAVGLGIGWALDAWLGTRPWLMLVFIILGGCAGILNVYRMASGYGYAAGYQSKKDTTNDQDSRD